MAYTNLTLDKVRRALISGLHGVQESEDGGVFKWLQPDRAHDNHRCQKVVPESAITINASTNGCK